MQKNKYMLIDIQKNVIRFKWLHQAQLYVVEKILGHTNSYIIIDTELDMVVDSWKF